MVDHFVSGEPRPTQQDGNSRQYFRHRRHVEETSMAAAGGRSPAPKREEACVSLQSGPWPAKPHLQSRSDASKTRRGQPPPFEARRSLRRWYRTGAGADDPEQRFLGVGEKRPTLQETRRIPSRALKTFSSSADHGSSSQEVAGKSTVHSPSQILIIINIADSLGARRTISLASSLKNHEGESFEGKAKCTTRGGEPNAASPGATFTQRIDGSSNNFSSGKGGHDAHEERNSSNAAASEKREKICVDAAANQKREKICVEAAACDERDKN